VHAKFRLDIVNGSRYIVFDAKFHKILAAIEFLSNIVTNNVE